MHRYLALLLVAILVEPSGLAAARLGPSVTLEGEAVPLAEAVDSIGRQLNLELRGLLPNPAAGRETRPFHLKDASPTAALASLQEALGCTLQRSGRYSCYRSANTPPQGLLGQPLGDWTVWLHHVRFTYSSSIAPRDPADGQVTLQVVPTISIQAPSDAEALRMVRVTQPQGVGPEGQEVAPLYRMLTPGSNSSDPSQWVLNQPLAAPPPGVKSLLSLSLEVVLVDLQEATFVFDQLSEPAERLLTEGELDLKLEARGQTRDRWQLVLTGPMPQPLDDPLVGDRGLQLTTRETAFDARLYDAADRPLYTQVSRTGWSTDPGRWTGRFTVTLAGEDRQATPERLVVRYYLPGRTTRTETVTFRHVPLPPQLEPGR